MMAGVVLLIRCLYVAWWLVIYCSFKQIYMRELTVRCPYTLLCKQENTHLLVTARVA